VAIDTRLSHRTTKFGEICGVVQRDDGDAVVDAEAAKVEIARHDDVGAAGDGAFEDAMVIEVARMASRVIAGVMSSPTWTQVLAS